MKSTVSPCTLIELGLNDFGIVFNPANDDTLKNLSEQHPAQELGFEVLVKAVLQLRHIELPDVTFSSDGNILVAKSWDLSSLQVVASIIRELRAIPSFAHQAMDRVHALTH